MRSALALSLLVCLALPAAFAVKDWPGGKLPMFSPNGWDGTFRVIGEYMVSKWRYSGFQLMAPTMSKWRFDWIFEQTPYVFQPANLEYMSTEISETGITGGDPGTNPYVNAYFTMPTTGAWSCWHVVVPKYWSHDYLKTAVEVPRFALWPPQLKRSAFMDYITPIHGNIYQLKGGYWDGKIVRIFNNSDVWVGCTNTELDPTLNCAIITAIDAVTGQVYRQNYFQSANTYYTDFYDFKRQSNTTDPLWKQSFSIPTALQNVTCYGQANTTGMYNNDGIIKRLKAS